MYFWYDRDQGILEIFTIELVDEDFFQTETSL